MPQFVGTLFGKVREVFAGYLRSTGTITAVKATKYHFFRGVVSWKYHLTSESITGAISRFAGRVLLSTKPIFRHSLSRWTGIVKKRIRLRKRTLGVISIFSGMISTVKYPWDAKRMFGTLTKRIWLQKSLSALIHFSGNLNADKFGISWFARLVGGLIGQVGTLTQRIRMQQSVAGLMQGLSGTVVFGTKRIHILVLVSTLIKKIHLQNSLVGRLRLSGILRFITTAIYRYPKSVTGRARFAGNLFAQSTGDLIETLYYGPPNP